MPHPFWCVVMRCEGSNPEGTPPPSVDRSCGHRVLQLQSRIRAGVQYSLCHLSPPSLSQLLRRYRWQAETCDHSIDDGRYAPRSMFRLGHHFHPDPLEWVFTCEATRESIFSNYAPRDDLTHPAEYTVVKGGAQHTVVRLVHHMAPSAQGYCPICVNNPELDITEQMTPFHETLTLSVISSITAFHCQVGARNHTGNRPRFRHGYAHRGDRARAGAGHLRRPGLLRPETSQAL